MPARVLLTNDDGPPGPESPYIYGLYRFLTSDLGWDVRVVIPSSQKSWIGPAYQIKDIIKGRYYYPTAPDGSGETSEVSRPLKEGEVTEWILLDGTPATCVNVALYNLYPGEVNLVISGPNLGRNTSSAFALSSGTLGATISSSLCKVRSIALSYGTIVHPTPKIFFDPAHALSCRIISHLWDNWGSDEGGLRNGEVDLYNINIPMVEGLLADEGLTIYWTELWRSTYGRLFKALRASEVNMEPQGAGGGPDSDLSREVNLSASHMKHREDTRDLIFKFSPDFAGLLRPSVSSLRVGTDAWAIHKSCASVTPLRASYAEPAGEGAPPILEFEVEEVRKMKL